MTEPITDETFYNEHAALVGHVALAWNDCHSVVHAGAALAPMLRDEVWCQHQQKTPAPLSHTGRG
jgi:hypothetical protein